jgi:polar amino acid transport system permease protein
MFETDSRPQASLAAKIISAFIALALVASIFYFSFHQITYRWNWHAIAPYRSHFFSGWLMTLQISATALVLSTTIGVLFALFRRSRILPFRYFRNIYVEVVRGTPLLVQILIFFYIVADAFHVRDRYFAGVLILSFFSGAYISEIVRAGIESIGR